MSNVLALAGATIGGWMGWAVGQHVGFMTAYMLSVVGTAAGVYGGRRAAAALAD